MIHRGDRSDGLFDYFFPIMFFLMGVIWILWDQGVL